VDREAEEKSAVRRIKQTQVLTTVLRDEEPRVVAWPRTSAIQEAEIVGVQFEASPGKKLV
jgi:hypothetical protein